MKSGGIRSIVSHYLLTEWPSALFVAALVFVIHNQMHWLDPVDYYAFIAVANQSAIDEIRNKQSKLVTVVEIDPVTHETQYRRQSPLSRCVLQKHFLEIYQASPDVLAVDLDISPANWASQTDESECEEKLYRLIEERSIRGNSSGNREKNKTRIVLLKPFGVLNDEEQQKILVWQTRMINAGVRFGSGALPIHYGLAIKRYTGSSCFATQARQFTEKKAAEGHPSHDEAFACEPEEHAGGSKLEHIDPRQYARLLPCDFDDTKTGSPCDNLSSLLDRTQAAGGTAHPYRVVFLGGRYGSEDTYSTPLGDLPGVEVHAGAYLSQGLDEHHLADLLGDVLIALTFGVAIACCWNQYFAWRLADDAWRRQAAPLWIAMLVISVVVIVFLVLQLSWRLLANQGIWFSPVAIAIGMLIDSFVSGTVEQAVHAIRHEQETTIHKLMDAKHVVVEELQRTHSDAAALAIVQTISSLQRSKLSSRSEPHGFAESLRRMFGGDILALWRKKKRVAGALLLAWSLLWIGFVAWAFTLAIMEH